jgi:hypothetical protein
LTPSDQSCFILFDPQLSGENMTEHHTLSLIACAPVLSNSGSALPMSQRWPGSIAPSSMTSCAAAQRGPGIDKLAEVARVLKVERDWLIHGIGEVEGEPPFIENPDETFVAIAHASPRPSMGGGAVVTEDHDTPGRAYHFRRSWIKGSLKASPSQLRIMHVEGDSMAPTLLDGDTVLVDMTRRAPNPPGIFVLDDGMGLVAKRLEHIPNSDPPAVRVISDNKLLQSL